MFAFVAFAGLNACSSDDDVVFIAQPDPEGISFVNTFNQEYVLTSPTRGNVAERFVWNPVNFDAPTNITYELQGSADPNFESFDIIGTTSGNNLAVTVSQMMSLAEDAGLDNDPQTEAPNSGQVYFRVRAFAGNGGGNAMAVTSEPQAVTVVLPETAVEEAPMDLFLVGDATATGWDNSASSNNYPLFRDPANPDVYYFTGKLNAGNIKIIEERGAWAPQYGGENGTLIYRPTEADPDPAAIPVSTAGYYTLTVDIDAMTYTLQPFDASSAPTYQTIGVIGDATANGWDSDQDMTNSEFDPHIWFIKGIQLTDGEIKFRANDNWDVNWGGDTPISGVASQNGPNIPVSEGTYEIWFNDLSNRYILIPME